MPSNKPTYSLEHIARLLETGGIEIRKVVSLSLSNHGFDPSEVVISTLTEISLGKGTFHKVIDLMETQADVYFVNALDERWYVKFYIVGSLVIVSCKPDGHGW